MLRTSKAVGGPRDGVRITADQNWDGYVLKPARDRNRAAVFSYPGKYVWQALVDRDAYGWVWVPGKGRPTSTSR